MRDRRAAGRAGDELRVARRQANGDAQHELVRQLYERLCVTGHGAWIGGVVVVVVVVVGWG